MGLDQIIFIISVFVFGSLVGSFLNVCIFRIPRKQSIVKPASNCPACKTPIAWYDNIPVISYLVLMGRCRICSAPISVIYPLVEFSTAMVSVFLFIKWGPSAEYVHLFIFWCALLVITVIDLQFKIIPDVISIPGIFVGFGFAFILPGISWIDSALGTVIGGGVLLTVSIIYYGIRKREGMGGGDIKLLAMIGAFLGWQSLLMTLFVASLAGSIVGIGYIMLAGKDRTFPIPFGPFLALGALTFVIWGQKFMGWLLLPMG